VSDIDDTVMVTALPRPFLAAWHTFVVNEHARATTPGMPVLYERLSTRYAGRAVHLLVNGRVERRANLDSLSVAEPLSRGALLLTDWGPTG
jgi:phosphatidate phosphatase APP1